MPVEQVLQEARYLAPTPTEGAEVAGLVAALGLGDNEVLVTLFAHGVRAETVAVLEWLPAVDVCWVDGVDAAERNALRVQFAVDERCTPAGLALLDGWLAERPPFRLFAAARRALASRLAHLDPDDRDEMLARIVGRCEAAGRAGGGGFGVGALSSPERDRIARLREDLDPPQ